MPFVTATNTTKNERRAIFTDEGYITIEPGKSRVVNVEEADQKANKDYFSFKVASQKDADKEEAERAKGELDRVNPAQPIEPASPDNAAYASLSDDALRDMIEDKTGKRPHHNTGRDKLVAEAAKADAA